MRRVVLLALLSGCGGGSGGGPSSGGAFAITPTLYDNNSQMMTDLSDGDVLDLVRPPQGGIVSFVGARVRGLAEATVLLEGRLLDGSVEVAQEGRTVDLQRTASDPSLWIPDLRSFFNVSNIPICPHGDPDDRMDREFTLEVRVIERSSTRSGFARRRVRAECRQTEAMVRELCRCECAGGYVLGKCMGTR